MTRKPRIIAIVGPTASGKSELAVAVAKKVGGEIVSTDSRQVYRGMDIGSGKVDGTQKKNAYVYKSIRHYGIDIASPQVQYSVARFQKYAKKIITDIISRGKVPIICGGTGQWVDAVLFDQALPTVKPDLALRKKLSGMSAAELFTKLKKLDARRAQTIDAKNPRRLIRALEIVITTGKPVPPTIITSPYDVIWLGITHDQETLAKRIDKRLDERLKAGMIDEIKKLHTDGLSWKRLEAFGLEYKFGALLLQKKLSPEAMREQLAIAIKQYAKRQMTWFKRNAEIHWIRTTAEALKLIEKHV